MVRAAPDDAAVTPFELRPSLLVKQKPGRGPRRRRSHREGYAPGRGAGSGLRGL